MSNSSIATDLDGLEGLESAKRVVVRLGREEAACHAVLFYGMEGSGKTMLARALTRAWLCKNAPHAPCGECQACGAFERGASADILHVEPDGASRQIKVDAVRPGERSETISITEFLRTAPLAARNKVVHIEDLDRMNSSAANAFLKTLEEPPERAKFVMTTAFPGQVLSTILSRCLAVRCELPALNPPADLEPELVASACGSPGELKSILADLEVRRAWLAFVKDLAKMERRDALKASERFRALAEKGPDLPARYKNAQAIELFSNLYRGSAFAQDAIVTAHRHVIGNVNASYVFDAMFAKILGEPGRKPLA